MKSPLKYLLRAIWELAKFVWILGQKVPSIVYEWAIVLIVGFLLLSGVVFWIS